MPNKYGWIVRWCENCPRNMSRQQTTWKQHPTSTNSGGAWPIQCLMVCEPTNCIPHWRNISYITNPCRKLMLRNDMRKPDCDLHRSKHRLHAAYCKQRNRTKHATHPQTHTHTHTTWQCTIATNRPIDTSLHKPTLTKQWVITTNGTHEGFIVKQKMNNNMGIARSANKSQNNKTNAVWQRNPDFTKGMGWSIKHEKLHRTIPRVTKTQLNTQQNSNKNRATETQ